MSGLTNETILKLIAGPVRKSSTGKKEVGYALVKREGDLVKVALSEVAGMIGGFQGKQGTIKRSRKGRAVIQPNGRRFYAPYGPSEVIAYKTS